MRTAIASGLPLLFLVIGGWLMIGMPGRSHRGPLPPLTAEETASRERLRGHIHTLAVEIGERNVWVPRALARTASYIESQLKALGYSPARQEFEVERLKVSNIEVERKGATLPDEIFVIGAHYDSVPGCPAANDNGSGVAGLLELARAFSGLKPGRTVRFVAFVNEEPPFFQTGQMGSLIYARRCRERNEKVVAMISLETMGYYTDEPKSQKYPPPLNLFYPSTGNFIGFVGNFGSRGLVRKCIASFRSHTRFPSEGAALPGFVPGVGWSDHWSFWKAGYDALMVTDTAPFRFPDYHARSDTPDKIDFDGLARVVAGVTRVVRELAGA
ncbi:MAG: M28 family peptidase [Planctomycetota bacterium]|jgi:Zn-dependent M28 family amino/carboxypeptidase